MPASYEMTWDGKNARWRKLYDGSRYVVSCRQLSKWAGRFLPETKEGSYQAANAWWQAKLAELQVNKPPHREQFELDALTQKRELYRDEGRLDLASIAASEAERIADGGELTNNFRYGEPEPWVDAYARKFPNVTPKEFTQLVDSLDPIMEDRIARRTNTPTPDNHTVGFQVARYITLEKTRLDSGQLSVNEYDGIQRCLNAFRDFLEPERPIQTIKADNYEDYWAHLLSLDISHDYKKKHLRLARTWLEWLATKAILPLLPNLHSRRYRFKSAPKEIATLSVAEVRQLIEGATGQLQLHLLLMANTGMTQIDIAELKPSDVDWESGRITRKRSKTSHEANVPTVSYKLWPKTFDLLKRYGLREGERALVTKSGSPWVDTRLNDKGLVVKIDNIRTNFERYRATLEKTVAEGKTLKHFRKTSASLLDTHPDHSRRTTEFLGHAPNTMRDKHYVRPSREQFDRAVDWLGVQFGFLTEGV